MSDKPFHLKSKLSQKYHYQFHNVRPRKVLEAAKHLVKTSELFQKEHIVKENWLNNVNGAASSERDDWEQFANFSTSTIQIDVLHYRGWTYRAFNHTE